MGDTLTLFILLINLTMHTFLSKLTGFLSVDRLGLTDQERLHTTKGLAKNRLTEVIEHL